MPRQTGMRYCRCGARLAADNPDRCLACVRKDHEQLQHPPELPLGYWLTERFDDAFAAQHIGLVSAAYRQSPYHRQPVSQERLGSWLGLSQPEVSRIEAGPPIRDLDRLTYWARTIKVPPELLWFDLPGRRRATAVAATADSGRADGRDVPEHGQAVAPEPGSPRSSAGYGQPADRHGQHDPAVPEQLAALLDAANRSPAAGIVRLPEGCGGLPATGLLPTVSPSSSVPSPPSDQLITPSDARNLTSGQERYKILTRSGEVLLVAMDRRLFMAGAGFAPLAIPALGTEAARQGLARTMLGDDWGSAEAWQAIAQEHGVTYPHTPPAEMFVRLSSDLAALREAFGHERSESGQHELRKTGAFLIALLSSTLASLGDLPACLRWAHTARQMADVSGDLHTRLWVRGREVVMGLYQQRPVGELLTIAEEGMAMGEAEGPPCTNAWPELMSGAAQALAVAGRRNEAKVALDQTRDGFDMLPDNLRNGSLLSFSEHNVRYTESYVYTYLDEYDQADAAQYATLRLYPSDHPRGPATVELMRALCRVREGDITAGVTHARETISGLPPAHRSVRTVVDLGRKVLEAVPVRERTGDEAVGLGELVGGG